MPQIELGKHGSGTGFLIGADLLLTAYYLFEPLIAGETSVRDVVLRFDYKSDVKGRTVSGGVPYRLASDFVASSPNDAIGYALARVENAPGAQPIGAERAEASAALRGWLQLQEGSRSAPR